MSLWANLKCFMYMLCLHHLFLWELEISLILTFIRVLCSIHNKYILLLRLLFYWNVLITNINHSRFILVWLLCHQITQWNQICLCIILYGMFLNFPKTLKVKPPKSTYPIFLRPQAHTFTTTTTTVRHTPQPHLCPLSPFCAYSFSRFISPPK